MIDKHLLNKKYTFFLTILYLDTHIISDWQLLLYLCSARYLAPLSLWLYILHITITCLIFDSNKIWLLTWELKFFFCILGTLSNVSPLNVSYKRPFIQGFWNGTAWILENGTPLVYTNWAKGHPQIDDEKRYIRSIKGKWQSTKSSAIRSIFCSYKP